MTNDRVPRYVGWSNPGEAGPGIVKRVAADGKMSRLPVRHDLANHSPNGFQWGYEGSGPAQLALALVADATGDDRLAKRTYQEFKRRVVAGLSYNWELSRDRVADLARKIDQLAKPESV